MKLTHHTERFLTYLEHELGRRPKTIENYRRYLEVFLRFVKTEDPQKISPLMIEKFRAHLGMQPGSVVGGVPQPMEAKTQDYYLIALRSFLKYLVAKGATELSPHKVELANPLPSPTALVTPQEVARLRKAAEKGTTPIDLRDRAIIELLLETGMSVGELCSLSLDDVSFKKASCRVVDRIVPLSLLTQQILKASLRARRDSDPALFVQFGKNAQNAPTLRLTSRTVQRILKRRSIEAGVTTVITPKTIRQYVAAELVQSGVSVDVVQARLGHQYVASTRALTRPASHPPLRNKK